ncbi:RING-H2 finger protein ATL67-like [Hordeum vulgare subsp. vulgare]|nr:RING-H2 finger protein ATL67-like [Hordeum vulgare subsp. vulgare]
MQPLAPSTHHPTTRSGAPRRDGTRRKGRKITTPPSTFTPTPQGLDSSYSLIDPPHPTTPHAHTTDAIPPPPHCKIISAVGATIAMSSPSLLSSLATLGLGYSIAIALGFLVLLASVVLTAYFCFRYGERVGAGGHFAGAITRLTPTSSSSHLSITVPRVLFVAEGSESPEAYSSAAAAASSPIGLHPAAIASYPKAPFSRAAGGDTMCSICLSEYMDGEMLRLMPECRHRFHVMCLDAWLRRSGSCPVCRSSPIPTPVTTPLATPLSELVPLSQYAADRRRSR